MDEIKPADCRGTADTLDAVDVDPVAGRGKGLIDEVDGLAHKLRQHETGITDEEVVQRKVSFDEGRGIFVGEIEIEDMRDSDPDEPGNISRQRPAALVDLRCYLSGFEGHIQSHSARVALRQRLISKMMRIYGSDSRGPSR